MTGELPDAKAPRVIADAQGCPEIRGWAESTITIQDGSRNLTFNSGHVDLVFKPRAEQPPVAGVVEYDLQPGQMTWTVSGTISDCTAAGTAIVEFKAPDPDFLAEGYMHVVARPTGTGMASMSPITTPVRGVPYPYVYEILRRGVFLLQILSWHNTEIPGGVAYKGQCETPDLPPPALVCSGMPQTPGNSGRRQTFKWDLRPATQPAPP
jgi:hypothetical protein